MSFEYKKPIIGQIRSGKEDDPFILITNDVKKITNGYCKLDEIPNELNHVTITSVALPYDEEVYYEIFDKAKDVGRFEYRVDYINGIVYFHNDAEGRIITFSYYGRGCQFISAERVFTDESNGNVMETLKNQINVINELINSIENDDSNIFIPVTSVSGIYTLDMEQKSSKSFRISISDTGTKTVRTINIPTVCNIDIELVYNALANITWLNNVNWVFGAGEILASGKIYYINFSTKNGGTNWDGIIVEG